MTATASARPRTHHLAVPGARLYYEVRGSGPIVAVIGSPMAARFFAPLADALASDHTVITYDPRGISGSSVQDPNRDSEPGLRGDDVAAILNAVGASQTNPADVFGSSGGAVTGLALVTRHPGLVRTLVAHEPPLLGLLPDAAQRCAEIDHIVGTFHRCGHAAAFAEFMATAGFVTDDSGGHQAEPGPAQPQPNEQELADSAFFFEHEIRPTATYLPDLAALRSGATRLVVGIGVDSRHLLTWPTSMALAERLGTAPVEFPGDHGGFLIHPTEFATRLVEVLGG